MKPTLFSLLASTCCFISIHSLCGAPARLIIRGDDMGYAHAGNQAIIRCSTEGIQTTVEILAPSPWFPEAVQLLKQHPDIDVGIHLTLTSEWDFVKWRPLSNCPSLQDADGYLFPMIFPNPNYPGRSVAESAWNLEEIENEFRAQIELVRRHLPHVSHLSYHMGCNALHNSVRALAKRLAQEYQLDIDPGQHNVQGVRYLGPKETSEEKTASFIKMLHSLEPDKTYLFVDHPGLNTPELQAIHHIGYRSVAQDRQGVTDTWTNPQVKQTIRDLQIQLIPYKALIQSSK